MMSRIPMVAIVAVLLAGFASLAIGAQDKYALKLGKLSFGDFKSYKNSKNVAVNQTEKQMKVILANNLMINRLSARPSRRRQVFPAGSKL